MTATAAEISRQIRSLGRKDVAEHSQRFFRTAPGEYGHGDKFVGVRVPVIRKIVRKHRGLPIRTVEELLDSQWHEIRLFAVLMLVDIFERGDDASKKSVFDTYLRKLSRVNNWDIVDSSAHKIIGPWLSNKERTLLYDLARSESLWDRRVAIMSTLHFIKQGEFADTLALAVLLLQDEENLIHKASGWMLREVGNRDRSVEEAFLKKHYRKMPRTMLRYAIEKFPAAERHAYLAK